MENENVIHDMSGKTSVKKNTGRGHAFLRVLFAATAVLLVCGAVFVGAGAAATDNGIAWSEVGDGSHPLSGTVTYYIKSQTNALSPKGNITVSGNVILDFQSDKGNTYTLNNPGTGADKGGLFNGVTINNGASLTITNLKITGGTVEGTKVSNTDGNARIGGLIGSVSGPGTLEFTNCNISGVTVKGEGYSVGGLVGKVTKGEVKINQCTMDAVSITSDGSSVGGLIGQVADTSKISLSEVGVRCEKLSSGTFYVGGLVARIFGGSTVEGSNCNVADVKITGNHNLGGLVGYIDGASSSLKLQNCSVVGCTIIGGDPSRTDEDINHSVGGLVGWATNSCSTVELDGCTVADCVIYAPYGYCGGIIGQSECDSNMVRTYQNNVVRNCLIYANEMGHNRSSTRQGAVGGIMGGYDTTKAGSQTCSSNTVEFCTVANQKASGDMNAGGIAGKFPAGGEMKGNKVYYTCVASLNGTAAGLCPNLVTTT